jgi:hypothetical protein
MLSVSRGNSGKRVANPSEIIPAVTTAAGNFVLLKRDSLVGHTVVADNDVVVEWRRSEEECMKLRRQTIL